MIIVLAPRLEPHASVRGAHAVVRYQRNQPLIAVDRFFRGLHSGHLSAVPPLSTVHLVVFVAGTLTRGRLFDAVGYIYREARVRSLLLVPCSAGMESRMQTLAQLAWRAFGVTVDACLEPGFGHGRVVRCTSFVAGAVPIVAPSSEHFPKFRRLHARMPLTSLLDVATLLEHTSGQRAVRPTGLKAVQVELGIAHAELAAPSITEE